MLSYPNILAYNFKIVTLTETWLNEGNVEVYNEFLEVLTLILRKVNREKKLLYITGDYNINLLNINTHKGTSDFVNTLYSHSVYPLINKPMRITKYSATIIDNIFTNNINNYNNTKQGLLFSDICDHLPIFHTIETNHNVTNANKFITKCIITKNYQQQFIHEIQLTNWIEILNNQIQNKLMTSLPTR